MRDVLADPGQPLDPPVREEMEARLCADFSDVRVHTGGAARGTAAKIGARAYTSGSHVVIGEGADKHTLAHELTHVIQQRTGPIAGTDQGDGLRLSDPSDPFERAAQSNAARVMSGSTPRRQAAPPAGDPVVAGLVMRDMLPVHRHREAVVDAAEELALKKDPAKASDSEWIQAIYKVLGGEGNPAADKCAEKLIAQRIIDQHDWDRIVADFRLYKEQAGAGFDLFERHAMPKIYNEDTADKWVASLIENRIADLYLTVGGFVGHAIQVQQSINQLVQAYENGYFDKAAYDKYKSSIISALRKRKANANLPIPEYTYAFENYSTLTI